MAMKFFISTGEHNGFYTLRSVRAEKPGDLWEEYYHRNLSRDWDEAYAKASARAEKAGVRLITKYESRWDLSAWGSGGTGSAKTNRYFLWLASLEDGYMPFRKHFGTMLCDLPSSYRRWLRSTPNDGSPAWELLLKNLERYIEEDRAIEAQELEHKARLAENEKQARLDHIHIGIPGQRVSMPVKCIAKIPYTGAFGPGSVSILIDTKGNKIKTFGKCLLQVGEGGVVAFTVKRHEEYRDEKQTLVTRLAIA